MGPLRVVAAQAPRVVTITQPGDIISPIGDQGLAHNGASGDVGEGAANAIDGTLAKYYNRSRYELHYRGSGFTVTPKVGVSVVTSIAITSGNDKPDRDPTSFSLFGSNDGGRTFDPIVENLAIGPFSGRGVAQTVTFANDIGYTTYKLIFPTVNGGIDMQVAEADLRGVPGPGTGKPRAHKPLPPVIVPAFNPETQLDKFDVTWDTQSESSKGSMPIGNGDIGANVWVEPSGDIVFYVSKTDAWGDNVYGPWGLPKVGRVRVKFSPNPFASGAKFRQSLNLRTASVNIDGSNGADRANVKLWIDANRPVIHMSGTAKMATTLSVNIDTYRTTPANELRADTIFPATKTEVAWCYRNGNTRIPELVGRTFGAVIRGDGIAPTSNTTLVSTAPSLNFDAQIVALTAQTDTTDAWRMKADALVKTGAAIAPDKAYAAHVAWWKEFWNRSWVYVTGDSDADKVTAEWFRQRYISACAGRGAYPIKFNGSIFTSDYTLTHRNQTTGVVTKEEVNGDYRNWGGQYWFQNTRPMYWPMLAAGDFDTMQALFSMYRNKIDATEKLVKQYYGHAGAYFAETSPFWPEIPNIPPDAKGNYTKHYFTPILELSAMMLDYYDYTKDAKFAAATLLPVADSGVTFFENHFGRDAAGKIDLSPDNAIEMYWAVRNPAPDIAGLTYVLNGLIRLPPSLTTPAQRDHWRAVLSLVPPLPKTTTNGVTSLAYFESATDPSAHNGENPELYAIYPFRLYGVGKPDLALARDTFRTRRCVGSRCWSQDGVQAAYLGLPDIAQRDVILNFDNSSKDTQLRFPTFWGPFHDYSPDEDNGGNGLHTLQLMLMQTDGDKIIVLPAWPTDWTASFKLHAAGNTIVEGAVANGSLTRLDVTPKSRRKDVYRVTADGSLAQM